jgi:hypothetical protein
MPNKERHLNHAIVLKSPIHPPDSLKGRHNPTSMLSSIKTDCNKQNLKRKMIGLESFIVSTKGQICFSLIFRDFIKKNIYTWGDSLIPPPSIKDCG